MASGSDLAGLLSRITEALEHAEVDYMVTGSVAASRHGRPRTTQDVDIVIAASEATLKRLLREFPDDRYYVSPDAAVEAFTKASMFNVIDRETGWKVDFIFRKPRPFSEEEFRRRAPNKVLGVQVVMVTPEDLLISKLEWAKLGESERQIRDAGGIIAAQGSDLDMAYIAHWVQSLDLQAQWEAARTVMP